MLTLADAQEQLAYYLEANKKLALGQRVEVSSGGSTRKMERAEALEQIQYWNRQCIILERGSSVSSQRMIICD